MNRLAIGLVFMLGACAGATVSQTAVPAIADLLPGTASVIPAGSAELREAPSKKARVHILARGHNAFVGRLELDAGASVPEHRDSTEEYIYVLEGSGTLMIDDVEHAMAPGTMIYMPANAKVTAKNGDAPLVGLQVFAGPEPAAKYDGWAAQTPSSVQ